MKSRTITAATLGLIALCATACGTSNATQPTTTSATELVYSLPAVPSSELTPAPAPEPAPAETSSAEPTPVSNATTDTVTRVIDGDTVEVSTDSGTVTTVRIIGIDAPETDTCEGQAAAQKMTDIVLNHVVLLQANAASGDVDKYGRSLRSITDSTDGNTDVGLSMIEAGHAKARYDSRDGYGAHAREPFYIAADDATPDFVCAPVTTTTASPTPTPAPAEEEESTECNYHDPAEIQADVTYKNADTNGDCHMTKEEFRLYMDAYSAQKDTEESVYYANCDAARAAGAAPLHAGEPGYRSKMDRDKDGVACE